MDPSIERFRKKVYDYIDDQEELKLKISKFKKPHMIWQAYIETIDSLGWMWKGFGRAQNGISDVDYSVAHILKFKSLPSGERRIIVCKMEELMKSMPFMKDDTTLLLYKNEI